MWSAGVLDVASRIDGGMKGNTGLWQGTQEGNRQRQDLAAYLAAASDSRQTPPPPTLPLHLRWSRAKHTLESWQQGKLSKVSPALSRAKPYSSDSRDIARYRAEQSRAEQSSSRAAAAEQSRAAAPARVWDQRLGSTRYSAAPHAWLGSRLGRIKSDAGCV